MLFSRRSLLVTTTTALLTGAASRAALAQSSAANSAGTDTRFTPRTLGNPNAKAVVEEWFSLTCIHCAGFAQETLPEVKKNLIDTGKVFYIFHDFPTDQLATVAAMVARSLPPERYEPFVNSLLSNLDRWAYVKDSSPIDALQKMAAFAGMSGDTFQKVLNDQQLMQFIMNEQSDAEAKYQINATPSFRFNKKEVVSSELSYTDFVKHLDESEQGEAASH
ncbi:thioredoxin domain-containing protein [Acetobacter sp. DsW_059]|uniref:thioredoxin domain-containing protein n=1 Tax=Acetobacter sp. DsW_059 TaxID=1670661 RepID=UPI000A3D4D2E|nr:thioredoxin domain-containing protein [Acetobacter sp. DsW_059]OUJ11656.1 thiol:disulfide interchange protein [Acetobacter sp. DsW_059]